MFCSDQLFDTLVREEGSCDFRDRFGIWRAQYFTLKFTVNFKDVIQIKKFQLISKIFTKKWGLGPGEIPMDPHLDIAIRCPKSRIKGFSNLYDK
jgi:hypothetical protein